jgi:hypothetical protein
MADHELLRVGAGLLIYRSQSTTFREGAVSGRRSGAEGLRKRQPMREYEAASAYFCLPVLLRSRAFVRNPYTGREAVSFTSGFTAWDGFHCFRRAVRFNDDAACPCVYHR